MISSTFKVYDGNYESGEDQNVGPDTPKHGDIRAGNVMQRFRIKPVATVATMRNAIKSTLAALENLKMPIDSGRN